MTRSLPVNPSHRFLQEEAKDALKAQRRGDRAVCPMLRLLRRFHAADDQAIVGAEVALHEVQFALAMDYGFPSWPAMKAHVESLAAAGAAETGAGDDPAVRAVLSDVPKVGFGRRLCPFPGSIEGALAYIGRPESYDYIMGVSGAAFRRAWHRDDGGNIDLGYFQPEPYRLLFSAIGMDYRILPVADKPAMIDAVKQSIARGRPVVAFGIIGPPEAGLICGYDRGGEVMIGHSYFDFERHSPEQPYYEKEGWFEDMAGKEPERGEPRPIGMIILGDSHQRPAPREVLRTSIDWAIDLARTTHRPTLPNHVCGLAACRAWADALEIDEDYEEEDPKAIQLADQPGSEFTQEVRVMVHGDQATMQSERIHAAGFLRNMSEHAGPGYGALMEAADLFEQAGKANVWPWKAKHYMADEVKRGLRDRDTRRELAASVREACRREEQAIDMLERVRTAMEQ